MKGYLLDANVPSEFNRDRPEPRVVTWLKAQPVTTLFLSAMSRNDSRDPLCHVAKRLSFGTDYTDYSNGMAPASTI
jgi:hypothetical protein